MARNLNSNTRPFFDLLYRHLFAIDPLLIYSLPHSMSYSPVLAEYILLPFHTELSHMPPFLKLLF